MAAEVKADKVTPPSGSLELVGNVLGSALSTALQAQDWTTANKLLTPARLADAFKGANQNLGTNGYQKLPGGLILQWGVSSFTTAGVAVTFPIVFPNSVLRSLLLGQAGNGGGYIYALNLSASGFTAHVSAGSATNHYWLAIGY